MEKLSHIIKRKKRHPYTTAVILAAGDSMRMGGQDKMELKLCGKQVLVRALEAFESSAFIDEIVIVTKSDKIMETAELCRDNNIVKVTKILVGGNRRLESALAGLSEINEKAKFVAIHDGARPLVTSELIDHVLEASYLRSAAIPCIQASDTIKESDGCTVTRTLNREEIILVQTPQCFNADLIKGALTTAVLNEEDYSDDAAAIEALSVPVWLVAGDPANIKITTELDVILAEAILSARSCDE